MNKDLSSKRECLFIANNYEKEYIGQTITTRIELMRMRVYTTRGGFHE